VAFAAEVAISFLLMSVILRVSNNTRIARFTPLFAGTLVATYITLESPISGMSMNPARTFSSALPGQLWQFLWIYFTAPVIGMLLAAELYVRARGAGAVLCAKLHHDNPQRCIFRCNYMPAQEAARG
jgi:aquaporin Z